MFELCTHPGEVSAQDDDMSGTESRAEAPTEGATHIHTVMQTHECVNEYLGYQ